MPCPPRLNAREMERFALFSTHNPVTVSWKRTAKETRRERERDHAKKKNGSRREKKNEHGESKTDKGCQNRPSQSIEEMEEKKNTVNKAEEKKETEETHGLLHIDTTH